MADPIRSDSCVRCIGESVCKKEDCPEITKNRLYRFTNWKELLEN